MLSPETAKCFWCKFMRRDHFGSEDLDDGHRRCPTTNGYSRKYTFLATKDD